MRKNDIIISTVRTYLKAVAKVEADRQIASTGFVVIRAKYVDTDFLQYVILSHSFISEAQFKWSLDGENYTDIGQTFDASKLSDEYSEFGEFTGAFVGITCGDRMMHQHTADFDFFDYQADESADVE